MKMSKERQSRTAYKTQWQRKRRDKLKAKDFSGVYMLGNSEHGWYKIGCARWVNLRISHVRQQVPFTFDVCVIWRHWRPVVPEKTLHLFFVSKRLHGEWFALSSTDVSQIEPFFAQHYSKRPDLRPVLI